MKVLPVPALLAAALFSAVVSVPFLPIARNEAGPFFFEAQVTASRSGSAQLFYDAGSGIRESDSSRGDVPQATRPRRVRIGVPSGTFRAFRLDPLDRAAAMTLQHARIVSASGRVLHQFAGNDFQGVNQIVGLKVLPDGVAFTMPPNSGDPQLTLAVREPIVARRTLLDTVAAIPRVSFIAFIGLVGILLAVRCFAPARRFMLEAPAAALRRPGRAIALVAAIAVVLSAYPVVFLGRSFVSPNHGTILLYDAYPALPGYDEHEVPDVQLSDVGAIMWQHVPFSMVQRRALLRGELPLWNRYNSLGAPLLGQGQSMFGDPLHFLVIVANGASWAWDLKYLIAKWLFATALALLVRSVLRGGAPAGPAPPTAVDSTLALGAALVVAAVSPFIGFFLYRLNHPAFFSLCYAPWALYAWIRIVQSSSRRGVALACAGLIVANLALMTSGTAKEAYMLLLTMNLAGVCALLGSTLPWRARLGRLVATAWAGALFALLTMPLWATFSHTLKHAYTSYNAASAFQLQPSLLLGLFDELFYRPLMPDHRLLDPSLNFVLLLGFLYFLATLRSHLTSRLVIALAIVSLGPLSLAFGLIPPQWVVRLPLLANVAHLDNTFSCALIVLWTVLAGVGFASAFRRLGTTEGPGDLVIVGVLLFALVFAWIAFRQVVHRPVLGPTTFSVHRIGEVLRVAPFVWGYLISLLAGAVILLLAARTMLARGAISALAGILLATGATLLLWRHALHAPQLGFRGFIQQPSVRTNFHARSEAVSFLRDATRAEPARGFGLHGNFFPGWTAAYALETVHSPDAIMSPRGRELVEAFGIERLWDWRLYVAPENVDAARPFLDALNVRWYLDLASDQGLLGRSLALARAADLDVYESTTAWPRAFFTDRVLRYNSAPDLVAAIRNAAGKPLAGIQTSDLPALGATARLPADLATRTSIAASGYRLTENSTSFTVHAGGPGIVVLTESWWPDDFRVEVNGLRAPVLRVNHAFKGVVVPAAGDYAITFRYWPHNFLRSLIACGIGAALLLISLALALRRAD